MSEANDLCVKQVKCPFRDGKLVELKVVKPWDNTLSTVIGWKIVGLNKILTGSTLTTFRYSCLQLTCGAQSRIALFGNAQFGIVIPGVATPPKTVRCTMDRDDWHVYLKDQTIVGVVYDRVEMKSGAGYGNEFHGYELENGAVVWFMKSINSKEPGDVHLDTIKNIAHASTPQPG